MRTLNIEVSDTSVNYVDGKLAGRIGEHNATQLIIKLPELLRNGVDYHIISFDTLQGSVVSSAITTDDTKEAYLSGDKIYCTLWQELTKTPALMFTVEAYAVTDNEPVMIAKSPYIDELYFEMSADDNGAQAETGGHGLACDVETLLQSSHSHSNKSLLDSYTQTESSLADAVGKAHSHENIELLNDITESFDTKADKAIPAREDSFAKLDGDGNLGDSGFTPDDFFKVAYVQGSGAFNTNASLNGFTETGRYAVSYKNIAANTEQTLFLDICNIDGAVKQYVFDKGTVYVRQLTGGSWSYWSRTSYVNLASGVNPGFGHIAAFLSGSSPLAGATITDSGCSLNDFVLKVEGMGLSSNDFTQYYKDKLDLLDPDTYFHSGSNTDLSRYINAGLHIFHGTINEASRPRENNGKDLLMLVADTIRDDVQRCDSCVQYAFCNSTIVCRSLTVFDNGVIAASPWTEPGGGESTGAGGVAVVDYYDGLSDAAAEGELAYVRNDTVTGNGAPIDLSGCPLHEDAFSQIMASYTEQGDTVYDAGWDEYRDNYTNCNLTEGQIKLGAPTYQSSESVLSLGRSGMELGSNYNSSDTAVFPALVLLSDDYENREDVERITFFPDNGVFNYGYMPGFAFNMDEAEYEAFKENGVTKYRAPLAYVYAFEDISGEIYGTDGMFDGVRFAFSEGWNKMILVAALDENEELIAERADVETTDDLVIPYSVGFWAISVDSDLEGQESTVVPLIKQVLDGMLIDISQQTRIHGGLYVKSEDGWRWIG